MVRRVKMSCPLPKEAYCWEEVPLTDAELKQISKRERRKTEQQSVFTKIPYVPHVVDIGRTADDVEI